MNTFRTLLVFLLVVVLACQEGGIRGNGKFKSDQRSLGEFTSVMVAGPFKVTILCGRVRHATVDADENLIPLIRTEVQNDQLLIYPEEEINPRTEVAISIGTDTLSKIVIAGIGSVEVHGINQEKITLVVSGAGNIRADGSAGEVSVLITGTGDISSKKLNAMRAHVTLTGAGTADVFATKQLDVEISGAGIVHYSGNPKEVSKNIRGVGLVLEN
jgi:hypothetical protein